MKRILTILLLLSLALLVVSCATETVEETATETQEVEESDAAVVVAGSTQVVIENSQFMPTDLEVKVGTTVEWVNKDSVDHTVTLENGDFDTELIVGATTTVTFNEVGEYRYFCQYHPGMQGSVIVS